MEADVYNEIIKVRKEMKPVDQMRVAVFLPDGGALSHDRKPLMLQEVLFCPVLTW